MLAEQHRQAFLSLQDSIDRLTQSAHEGVLTTADIETAQQVFQTQVLPLDLEALNPTIASKVQSIQTEIGKQLRLLSTDILFLKAARQSATLTQRQTQIHDRLTLLKQYCHAVLEQAPEPGI